MIRDAFHDVIVAYWPIWLLVIGWLVLLVEFVSLCVLGARDDRLAQRVLDERAARAAVRPSPAPIDVEPVTWLPPEAPNA